jgi:hypothetical protein
MSTSDRTLRRGRRREIIFALATLLAALLFALLVIPAGVTQPSSVKHLPLSPVFLPYVLTLAVALFALVHLAEAVWAAHIPDEDAPLPDPHPRRGRRLALLAALLLAYLMLPDRLGMLLTAILVTIALIAMGGERRLPVLFGVGIAVPLLVYLFFVHVAQVPMPAGLFEEWL